MEDDAPSALTAWRRWTDVPLLALAIGSLPLLYLELLGPDLPDGDKTLLRTFNVVLLVAFSIDLVVELAIVRRARHVLDQWDTVAVVVAQVMSLLAKSGPAAGAFRVVRPAIHLVRAVAIGGSASRNAKRQFHDRPATIALGSALVVWITSAVAFTCLEDLGRDGFRSFTDALWWSATTITTVGYGDVSPVTGPGKVVAVFTMVIGISTFAVVTAKIAQFLVRPEPA